MTTDGWEQRLDDLGQARELREDLALTAHHVLGRRGDCPCGQRGRLDCEEIADALLSGPLAPLLAAQAAVERVRALVRFYDRHEYASLNVDDLRRALDGPT